ncbi:MAG: hypothetical protein CMLOHMNK_02722 [Steroidobacteraceae bacterium]|nr:hypothetical protein [Steroidobacteraceae bacterium]
MTRMPLNPSRLLLAAALCAVAGVAQAGKIDLSTPEGATLAMRKIQCSVKDNEPVIYYWNGSMFSRVEGEPDRRLFHVEAMNIRACVTVKDPAKGTGWRLVSRELLLYMDPKTGEVLKNWTNPWTGKTLEVLHIENDPVNQPPMFPVGRDGQPVKWAADTVGDQWWLTLPIPLYYNNPLGGAYQDYVGGKYHATEMFNFLGDVSDLVNDKRNTANVRVAWVRLSNWLPWMEMGDRQGLVYYHTSGRKIDRFEDLPAVLRHEIETNYPKFKSPPPGDDARPNETSWTYFQKKVAPKAAAPHR